MAETLLRDGRTTEDPRLDRIPYTSPKQLSTYPVAELLEAPPARRGKSWQLGPQLDQGQRGDCVGVSIAAEAGDEPMPANLTADELMQVAAKVQRRAQELDPWPETWYPDGEHGTSIDAGGLAAVEVGLFSEFRWARSVDELIDVLIAPTRSDGSAFGTSILGVYWPESAYRPDPETGIIEVSGRWMGGHAIRARGVMFTFKSKRLDDPLIRLPNTWGSDWGVKGEALISASSLESILGPDPEIMVPVYRRRPEP